jgi:hypothetical protein
MGSFIDDLLGLVETAISLRRQQQRPIARRLSSGLRRHGRCAGLIPVKPPRHAHGDDAGQRHSSRGNGAPEA